MIKRFIRWLWPPDPDRILDILQQMNNQNQLLLDYQAKIQQKMFEAVDQIGLASQQQAKVLSSYLDLFKYSGDPEVRRANPEKENMNDLIAMGYPSDATESQQAEWVLKNLERL